METNQALIKTPIQEELLADINKMRQANLYADTQTNISELARIMTRLFLNKANQQYGINENQIVELSPEKQMVLIRLVHERICREARISAWFCLCFPVFGWFIYVISLDVRSPAISAIGYKHCIAKLKKSLGMSFDPVETIKNRL